MKSSMKDLLTMKAKKRVKSPDRGSSLFYGDMGLGNMNDRALLAIVAALDRYEEPPRLDWPDHEREEVTFTRWALEEILDLVWDHPWTLASETIENFALTMMQFAATSVTKEQKRIFSIASDAAFEFLEEIEEVEKL